MFKPYIHALRSISKMLLQNSILPIAYTLAKLRHPGEKKLYVFADAHHTSLPFSLAAMYDHVLSMGVTPVCKFRSLSHTCTDI